MLVLGVLCRNLQFKLWGPKQSNEQSSEHGNKQARKQGGKQAKRSTKQTCQPKTNKSAEAMTRHTLISAASADAAVIAVSAI